MATTGADKVRENLLRRTAARRGMTLRKSPRRDTFAPDYGLWVLEDTATGRAIVEGREGYCLTLDEVASHLGV